jgi:hypothetical protein
MQDCESKDQFGVNFNFDYVLLQVRERSEDFEECRIKLTLNDVENLIESLNYYADKIKRWKESVGAKKESETDAEYMARAIQSMKDNNYFTGRQEE